MTPFAPELTALVRTVLDAACPTVQAAGHRFISRALGCGGGYAYLLLPPLHSALRSAAAAITAAGAAEGAVLGQLFCVLRITVPLLRQPMAKAMLLERGPQGQPSVTDVLGRLLHQVVAAWNAAQDVDAELAEVHRTVCRLLTDAIRAVCDPQVRPLSPAVAQGQALPSFRVFVPVGLPS